MREIVHIEKMSYGSDAIAHLKDGRVVFVAKGVPGDLAEIEIVEERKSFLRAKIVSFKEASEQRIRPFSLEDEACGTACWQTMSYDSQLFYKRTNVLDALVRIGGIDPCETDTLVHPCIPSPQQWHYRNKIELSAGADEKGRFVLGYMQQHSHTLVPMSRTRLAHREIEKAPAALTGALRYLQGRQDLGIWRIGVRHSEHTNDLQIALWTRPGAFPRALVAKTLSSALKSTSIVRVMAYPDKPRKIKGLEVLQGKGVWKESLGSCRFATQAPSFFQVNTEQAERLIETALEMLNVKPGMKIADLYSGGGTFSIPLARAGGEVYCVESVSTSVRDLKANAQANQVKLTVKGGDAARELAGLGHLDILVVDPPRAGIAASMIDDIVKAAPEQFLYVSCDPATLARDIKRLCTTGAYRLVSVIPVDMFPQTYHVECVVLLSKKD